MLAVRIHWNSLIAKILFPRKRMIALTLGRHIFIRVKEQEYAYIPKVKDQLLQHETCHVKQYRDLGFWTFVYRYIKLWLKHGYRDHPMEDECR